MTCRTIFLPSPREPSGATWLINCLLELGVRTFRYSPRGMWRRQKGQWRLNAHEQVLRKWLPALSDHDSFDFREDIEVQWMHEWRSEEHADSQILYFVRDPRDSLFSRYKREAPQLSFSEFVAFPDVRTLLDKIVTWKLFNEAWLSHPRLTVVRFEDYKQNAERTLRKVLSALCVEYSDADVNRALQASTFERAAAAERVYRAEHPDDSQLINRSGRPMEWESGKIDRDVTARIESICADVLAQLEYRSTGVEPAAVSVDSHLARLGFFQEILLDTEAARPSVGLDRVENLSRSTLEFVMTVNAELLTRACLPKYELDQLKASLLEFLDGMGNDIEGAFARAAASDAIQLPGVTLVDRVTQGLVRRIRRLIGSGV